MSWDSNSGPPVWGFSSLTAPCGLSEGVSSELPFNQRGEDDTARHTIPIIRMRRHSSSSEKANIFPSTDFKKGIIQVESGKAPQVSSGQGFVMQKGAHQVNRRRRNSGNWNSTCKHLDNRLKPPDVAACSREPSACGAPRDVR